jgi:pyruvate kinase
MRKKTKIVATISDKTCTVEFIRELYESGMDVVRLNTAHQTHDDALKVINMVREVSDKIAILLDTKGPEIRTNSMDEDLAVELGQIVKMKGAPNEKSTPDCINLSYAGFVRDVKVGSKVLIDDGILELLVIGIEGDCLLCEVQNAGRIQGRKSVNIPSALIKLPALTQKDMAFIQFAAEQNLDFIAHSFVRKADDVVAVQSILDAMGSSIKIIAKIENEEGVNNIDEILEHVYGIMVARGDLAIEISSPKLPVVQRDLVKKCVEARKPVIVATQMLHTMIENPRPTRAEVNDIANAIFEGADAIMLSGETAYGKYPVESVKMMNSIAKEVEESLPDFWDMPTKVISSRKSAYMVKAAVEATVNLPIRSILADTDSGNTVRGLSAYRGKKLIYAHCYSKETMRALALSFGVYADYIIPTENHADFIRKALDSLLLHDCYSMEDMVAVVAGSFGKTGGTSFLEIGSVAQLLNFIGE